MGKTALIHSVIHQKVHIAESIVNIKSGIFCLYRDANLNIQDNVSDMLAGLNISLRLYITINIARMVTLP